jgi:hypothetical protein
MIERKELYAEMFESVSRVMELIDSTLVSNIMGTQPYSKWMTLPDMGYVITRYQRVLVSLSKFGCFTFLPLVGSPPQSPQPIMGITHVQGLHYV